MTIPSIIASYFNSFPEEASDKLLQLRHIIISLAPEAEEILSYGMPAFRLNKRILVYYAAYKRHIGLYPSGTGIESFKHEFGGFKWSKGTIQFPLDQPLPVDLIERMIRHRVSENLSFVKGRKA